MFTNTRRLWRAQGFNSITCHIAVLRITFLRHRVRCVLQAEKRNPAAYMTARFFWQRNGPALGDYVLVCTCKRYYVSPHRSQSSHNSFRLEIYMMWNANHVDKWLTLIDCLQKENISLLQRLSPFRVPQRNSSAFQDGNNLCSVKKIVSVTSN